MNKRLRIFAGPNGSGKTSLYTYLTTQHYFQPYFYINADLIYNELITTGFSVSNWPIVLKKNVIIEYLIKSSFLQHLDIDEISKGLCVKDNSLSWNRSEELLTYISAALADYVRYAMLQSNSSYSCETVFSHESKLKFMADAKTLGYKVYLYFISTEQPLINIDRIQNRVDQGGHSVPEKKIWSRYYRTMDNLLSAIRLADKAYLFDNSSIESGKMFQNFAEIHKGDISLLSDTAPAWFNTYILDKL
jgi:predicted ABC-type ATPase